MNVKIAFICKNNNQLKDLMEEKNSNYSSNIKDKILKIKFEKCSKPL